MKNVFVAMAVTLGLMACGSIDKIDIKPDTSGSGGSGSGSMGNGSGGDAGSAMCDCPTGDGSRLSRQYLVGDDGSKMESFVWYDKDLDLKCAFQSLPNGQTYCVPQHEAVNTYFDAGCVIPAYVRAVDKTNNLECTTLPSYVRYGEYQGAGLCGLQGSDDFKLYRVNRDKLIARAPVHYEGVPGDCKVSGQLSASQEWAIWEVVEIGSLTDFVKAVSGVGF
jgi:hypothetical protein